MHAHYFRPKGPDRLAVVSVIPSSQPGLQLVQVARGPKKAALTDVKVFGPYSSDDVAAAFSTARIALENDGFLRSGLAELLVKLDAKQRKTRARAAVRAYWLRERAASDALLSLAKTAAAKNAEELPIVLDALAEIGDPRAVVIANEAAEKKLLSRRRAGFEALRKLNASELIAAKERAGARLTDPVRAALGETDKLVAAVKAAEKTDRGLAIDTLYELDARAAVLRLLSEETISAPHIWRYSKSVMKRAMLRGDHEVFGLLAQRIERLSRRSDGEVATVKSGYDGESKSMLIFGTKTQRYMMRASWRYLARLARYRDGAYPLAAAEVLAHYTHEDEALAQGKHGAYAEAHLLMRILFGASDRFEFHSRTLIFETKKATAPKGREEAFADLWDRVPTAYLRVLCKATLPVIASFALRAVKERHPGLIATASADEVAALIGSPLDEVSELGVQELDRRFDPTRPDIVLIAALLRSARPHVLERGLRLLEASADVWARSAEAILALLESPADAARAVVMREAIARIDSLPVEARRTLATFVLAVLGQAEKEPGENDAYAQLARALARDIAAMISIDALLKMLDGSLSAQGAAAAVLAVHPGAKAALTVERLIVMAEHSHAMQREAARVLLELYLDSLVVDPSPLLELCESEWPDTRVYAVQTLSARIPLERLGADTALMLVDSHVKDAQDLGTALITKLLDTLDPSAIVKRLAEHPHRNVKRYALFLAVGHLKPGLVALAPLEPFFRSLLLDVGGEREVKNEAIAFLHARALQDEGQAEICVRLLGEMLRSKTLRDSERALVALAEIAFRYPELASLVRA